ncbi:MAG: CHASE3 domain-containing protein [Verrucomicrobia bacterium]|nr:CHASE3 domain-containing protein [Verrucomicrobiota bacterium]
MRTTATVYAITAAVVIGSTFVTYSAGNRVGHLHQNEQQRRQGISRLDDLLLTLQDAETGQRGYILTGDENYLEPFNAAEYRLENDMAELRKMSWLGLAPADVTRLNDAVHEKMAELRQTIALRRQSGMGAALPKIIGGTGKQAMDRIRDILARLKADQEHALQDEGRRSDRATLARTIIFAATDLLNVLVLLWGFLRIRRALVERDAAVLQEQHQRGLLSTTLASIGDCVIVTNAKGAITFMNGVAESLTGWPLAEARHRPVKDVFRIVNEQTREPVDDPVEKVIRHGVIVGLANHTLLVRRDGSEVPIDDSGAPIRGEQGELEGVVLVFRDFSEHKRAQRELREAKEAAEAASEAKDKFLAMLSHELRTPLTPVLATLNVWEMTREVPERLRSDLQMLRRNVELEARIIDDLLDLTRVARGVLSFSPEVLDVHELIQMLLEITRSEAEGKRLHISVALEAERHFVNTDAGRLQQVLWNIVRNAINFTDAGGEIVIRTRNDGRRVVIAISDSGIGMTPETIARLFLPFEQADRARSIRYGGLGLGMAISRALVELMGGTLTAESEGRGRGSTFFVALDWVNEITAPRPALRQVTAPVRNLAILLVEDHVDTATALTRVLRMRGHEVQIAGTVAAALDAIERQRFDLFLCDVGLPDGTGYDLIKAVRQKSSVPAVALTGFGMSSDVDRALEAGFDAHLTKPVDLHKLELTIGKLVEEPRVE